jgi:hypothetical protein
MKYDVKEIRSILERGIDYNIKVVLEILCVMRMKLDINSINIITNVRI